MLRIVPLLPLGGLLLSTLATAGGSLPAGFVLEPWPASFERPVDLAFLDAQRTLVAEKAGRVWLVEGGLKQNLVVDLADETLSLGDLGLLAVEADPAFAANGRIYLSYVVDPDGDGQDVEQASWSRLIRLSTALDAHGELHVVPGSRRELVGAGWSSGIPSCHQSHAVGSLGFAADGSLLVATGDGASFESADGGGLTPDCFGPGRLDAAQDVGAFRAQRLDSLSGKILRIDPATGRGLADNPFFTGNVNDPASRVFALGLRNPFRFLTLPAPEPALLVADVGWNSFEELDLVRGGENFGWPCTEGDLAVAEYAVLAGAAQCGVHGTAAEARLAVGHSDSLPLGFTANCISGLAIPTASSYPPIHRDRLFFCDYAHGWIRSAELDLEHEIGTIEPFASGLASPIDLEVDPATGELLLIEFALDRVARLRYLGSNLPPVVVASVEPRFGALPLDVHVDASGSHSPSGSPLVFRWSFGDGTGSTEPSLAKTYPGAGSYTIDLSVVDAEHRSSTASFLVTPGNTPPEVGVLQPAPGSTFHAGELVTLQAFAQDLEDDAAGLGLARRWTVSLHHDHHVHPEFAVFDGLAGDFPFTSHGPGTWVEARFEARDSAGLASAASVLLYDADAPAQAHLLSVSDATPRAGQSVTAVGHVHHPGDPGGLADLVWDWGDGTQTAFPGSPHGVDTSPAHVWTQAQTYTVTLTASFAGTTHAVTQTISVAPARPALAIFTPLAAAPSIPWLEQAELAQSLAASLAPTEAEIAIFRFDQQAELAAWMETYESDGVRDVVLVLDAAPSAVYAGEDEGSLAARWLEAGNGIVWSGSKPFALAVTATGVTIDEGLDAGDVLAAGVADPCSAQGQQALSIQAPLAGLHGTVAQHGLRYPLLAPLWQPGPIYAAVPWVGSDALVVTRAGGGFYAQMLATDEPGLDRTVVLAELLRPYL